jgi:hypothetical protein
VEVQEGRTRVVDSEFAARDTLEDDNAAHARINAYKGEDLLGRKSTLAEFDPKVVHGSTARHRRNDGDFVVGMKGRVITDKLLVHGDTHGRQRSGEIGESSDKLSAQIGDGRRFEQVHPQRISAGQFARRTPKQDGN